jgi:hypothetical protein
MSALLVRVWTSMYTFALPFEIRERRRAEIESDLWESAHDPDVTRLAVMLRLVKGMPADLLWRIEMMPTPEQARAAVWAVGAAVVLAVTVWAFVRQPVPPPKIHRPLHIDLRLVPPPPPPRG